MRLQGTFVATSVGTRSHAVSMVQPLPYSVSSGQYVMVTSDGLVQSVVVTDVSGREVYYANGLLVNSPIVIPGNVFCVPGLYGIALNNFTGSVRTLLPVVP